MPGRAVGSWRCARECCPGAYYALARYARAPSCHPRAIQRHRARACAYCHRNGWLLGRGFPHLHLLDRAARQRCSWGRAVGCHTPVVAGARHASACRAACTCRICSCRGNGGQHRQLRTHPGWGRSTGARTTPCTQAAAQSHGETTDLCCRSCAGAANHLSPSFGDGVP